MQKRTLSAPLIAVFGLLALLVLVLAPAAQATHVSPTYVAGNPSCADLGLDTITKFEPVRTETDSGIAMTKSGDTISFTSTVAVDAVIVKGGPNANVYSYAFDTFADSGLSAPDNGGKPYGLSHVEFCTDEANEPEPEPEPGIDIEKSVDKAVAYPGETLNYTLTVTNTGDTTLNGVDLADELCDAEPVRSGGTRATPCSTPATSGRTRALTSCRPGPARSRTWRSSATSRARRPSRFPPRRSATRTR